MRALVTGAGGFLGRYIAEQLTRRGDRVVVKTTEGEVMAKELYRRTARKLELHSLNPEHQDRTLEADEVLFVHRVLWSSQ